MQQDRLDGRVLEVLTRFGIYAAKEKLGLEDVRIFLSLYIIERYLIEKINSIN